MLDDEYNVNGNIFTGREICHASGLNQKETCLAITLLQLGFAGIDVERVEPAAAMEG